MRNKLEKYDSEVDPKKLENIPLELKAANGNFCVKFPASQKVSGGLVRGTCSERRDLSRIPPQMRFFVTNIDQTSDVKVNFGMLIGRKALCLPCGKSCRVAVEFGRRNFWMHDRQS